MLIALAILGLILGITYAAIAQGMRVQSGQEAATSTQARLRRVAEVFTQEIRSAVLGAVGDLPYESGTDAVSFMLLDGGAGFQVTTIDAPGNNLRVMAPASSLGTTGTQMMLVDAGGQAVVFTLSGTPTAATGGNVTVRPSGSACFLGLSSTSTADNLNALLFRVKTVGLSYDGVDTLNLTEGNLPERPLAFNLSGVEIEYVYRSLVNGNLFTFSAPLQDTNGRPARNAVHSGQQVELLRLQITLESRARALTGMVERSYVSQVDLASNPNFSIKAVSACN